MGPAKPEAANQIAERKAFAAKSYGGLKTAASAAHSRTVIAYQSALPLYGT
jgi:hypothetical protein